MLSIVVTLLSDWGPLFYFANRMGKDNKRFKMWKFRSMRVAKGAYEASLRPDQDNAIAATVPCGLTSQSSLWDYIYGDQFPDEEEYNEKVLPIRLKLDVYYVKHASFLGEWSHDGNKVEVPARYEHVALFPDGRAELTVFSGKVISRKLGE